MTAVDSPTTSKEENSSQTGWSVEEWWAEKMLPSRKQNLTPSQRALQAALLRLLRRARFQEKQSESTSNGATP